MRAALSCRGGSSRNFSQRSRRCAVIAYTEARLLYLEVFSSGGKGDAMPKATIIALRDHLQEIRTKVDQEQVMQSSRAAQEFH